MKKIVYSALLAVFFTIMGCEKQNLIDSNSTDTKSEYGTIPEFKSIKDFFNQLSTTSKMSQRELDLWEKQNNFYSLRKLYNDIVEEHTLIIDKEEKLIKENPELAKTMKPTLPSLYLENKNLISFSIENGYQLNISDLGIAAMVNKYGLVRIGGVIHQLSKNKVKIIKRGDDKLISSLVNYNKEGDYENGITVRDVKSSASNIKNGRIAGTKSCQDEVGDYKILAWIDTYANTFYDFYNGYYTNMRTVITSQHKRLRWYGWALHNSPNYSFDGYLSISSHTYERFPGNNGYFNTGYEGSIGASSYNGNTHTAQYYFLDENATGVAGQLHQIQSGTSVNMHFLDCQCQPQ